MCSYGYRIAGVITNHISESYTTQAWRPGDAFEPHQYKLVSFLGCCKEGALCRLYNSGSKLSEGAVMAADASLSLERVSGAMHAMFDMLSKPDILPELNALQV